MPTVIDSIQIEIQSGSTNAASGIDSLAKSLEKLKNSGKITTVVKNLHSLSDSLKGFTDASGSASSLHKLANAIERLKGIGSIASITNNLTKLPGALKSIQSVDMGRVAPQLQDIADAARPLTEIKTSGLNGMVNALSKIGKVTADLDKDKIAAFAAKVKELNEILGPLSEKMATIKTGFGAINTGANRAAKAVQKFDEGVNTTTLNLSSFIEVARTFVQTISGAVRAFINITAEAIEWDGIAARFGRGFGSQAQETYDWIQRLNEEMGINVQQFMQYSSLYAQMLTGFGVAHEDAGKMALGYTELTYDVWAAANDRYKTFGEAAEAVASAIAGEVEPIRRAGFTIIESTLEQTAANHGLSISLENATEAEKSYLRYLTLVDQAHSTGVIGSYARELNTAEGMTRMLSQQIKSLTQAFGSLFLPILVKIIPYVQVFVELLEEGIRAVAALFGIKIQDIGDTWQGYGAGAESATEGTEGVTGALNDATKAAKEFKNASIGIDELNVISPPSASAGSGGSGGGGAGGSGFSDIDVGSLWDESIFKDINNQVDEIKAKFKEWLPVITGVATALGGLRLAKLLDDIDLADLKFGKLDLKLKSGLGKTIAGVSIVIGVGAIVQDYTNAYLKDANEADLMAAIGATALGAAIARWIVGKGAGSIVVMASGLVMLSELVASVKDGEVKWDDPQAVTTGLVGAVEVAVGGWFTWKTLGPTITAALKTLWPKITAAFTSVIGAISTPVAIGAAIVAAIAGAVTFAVVDYDFTDVGTSIGTAVGNAAKNLGDFVTNVGGALKDGWASAVQWFKDNFDANTTVELIEKMLDPEEWKGFIGAQLKKIGENLLGNAKELFGGFLSGIATVFGLERVPILDTLLNVEDVGDITELMSIRGLVSKTFEAIAVEIGLGLQEGLEQSGMNFGDWLLEKFNAAVKAVKEFLGIESPSTLFRDIGANIIAGLVEPFTIESIKDKLVGMWGNAKGWWDDKKEKLSEYIPEIGDIGAKVSSAWESAKTWWSKKPALSEYTPKIGDIKAKVSSAWDSAKKWYDSKKAALKEYTPSIGSIYDKMKTRWDNARTWWNDKKTKAKEYTPSIGSIYEKMKERWDNARTWWNSKKTAANTYTPSIGSIKDKLVSAWNTAKSWWNKNVGGLSTKLDIKVPKISVNWATASAFGKEFRYPTGFNLNFAKDGGVFDAGSLIWAGEHGAEILANAGGGRTGVMNIEQMQEAVYEGVYAAVTAAMSRQQSGGAQGVNVYLDSRQITSTVEQRQREKGASLMGNEVFSH